jgi:hypothetical protein
MNAKNVPAGFRWALYRRRSTDEHQMESLQVQLENGARFIRSRDGTLGDHHVFTDDAVSRAEFKKRPGLLSLLNAAQRKAFDAVETGSGRAGKGGRGYQNALYRQMTRRCTDGFMGNTSDRLHG